MSTDQPSGSNELNAILAEAIARGAEAVEFEYDSGGQLEVMFTIGNTGMGYALDREAARAVRQALQQRSGQTRLTVENQDYLVRIKTYDSFGETAYRASVRKAKR